MSATLPSARYAFQEIHAASPALRVRYREGVVIGPHGFPEWDRYARAVVELPPPLAGLTMDEVRVLGVLIGNELMARAGDPLWPPDEDGPPRTPAGWTWAYQAMTRRIALVPAELHGSFRHLGGLSTLRVDRGRRGVTVDQSDPVAVGFAERVADDALAKLEEGLGYRLPDGYRRFLAETNGGRPRSPAVHPRHGFVADQPMFGLARPDRAQDLTYAPAWFSDRLTGDFLALGYVQGGLMALQVRGDDTGSVWYADDDDYRDVDEYGPEEFRGRLLSRCADDLWSFLAALRPVPRRLRRLAAIAVDGGHAHRVEDPGFGAALPAARRAPAQTG